MIQSILTSTKKSLGIDASYTAFDEDVIVLINSAFSTLNQLGIGPENGYAIEDASATWSSFIGSNLKYSSVKTFVLLSVRLIFDNASMTAHVARAMKEERDEIGWRLNVVREETEWVDPTEDDEDDETPDIIDGGDA
jgi:hypothetical protein